jgi:hypothetical protein
MAPMNRDFVDALESLPRSHKRENPTNSVRAPRRHFFAARTRLAKRIRRAVYRAAPECRRRTAEASGARLSRAVTSSGIRAHRASFSTSLPARSSPGPTSRGRADPATHAREDRPRPSGGSSGNETRVAASTSRRTVTGARRPVASNPSISTRGCSPAMWTHPRGTSCDVHDITTMKAGSSSAGAGARAKTMARLRERPARYGARSSALN